MDRGAAWCCAAFFGLPLFLSLTIWTVLICQNYAPTCSIEDLYIPALNTKLPCFNSTTTTATFIFFDIQIENVMSEVGIRYDSINITFYYGPTSIANYNIPGFYQGHGKTAHRRDVVETEGVPWLEAFGAVSNSSTVVFRVELAATVKMKRSFWYSGGEELLLGRDVEVNGLGEKVQKKGIKLAKLRRAVEDKSGSGEFNDPQVIDSVVDDVHYVA